MQQGAEGLTPEQNAVLQEDMLKKTFHAMWCINKMDIEHVLRVACENILLDDKVPLNERLDSARLLQTLGGHFIAVSKKKQQQELQEERKRQREIKAQQKKDTKAKVKQ